MTERNIVPLEAHMIELHREAETREAQEARHAGIRVRVIHNGRNVLDVPVVDIIGDADLLRLADDELVGLAEDYLTETQPQTYHGRGSLGKVAPYRPDGENIVIGPPPQFGERPLHKIAKELQGPCTKGALRRISSELLDTASAEEQRLYSLVLHLVKDRTIRENQE